MDQHEAVAYVSAPKTPVHIFLLWYGLAGSILFNLIYFSQGIMAPHYDVMRQPISDLGLLHSGWIQSVNFIFFGLSVCAFAMALRIELHRGFGITLLPLLHGLTGLGLILAGIFIQNPLHNTALLIALFAVWLSFLLLAIRLRGQPGWKGWTSYTVLSLILMIALFAWFIYAHRHGYPYAGVFERLVVVTRLIWVTLFTLQLIGGRRLLPANEQGA